MGPGGPRSKPRNHEDDSCRGLRLLPRQACSSAGPGQLGRRPPGSTRGASSSYGAAEARWFTITPDQTKPQVNEALGGSRASEPAVAFMISRPARAAGGQAAVFAGLGGPSGRNRPRRGLGRPARGERGFGGATRSGEGGSSLLGRRGAIFLRDTKERPRPRGPARHSDRFAFASGRPETRPRLRLRTRKREGLALPFPLPIPEPTPGPLPRRSG